MTREDPQFKLRVPQGLRDAIEKSAKLNKRSMNAEIIARVEQSFSTKQATGLDGDIHELMAALLEKLGPQYKLSISLIDEKDDWKKL
ncbi:Arc family DNA-binding protein [Leeia sp. TBRC 13508]|uniref:Arc family DNA-binding protein n=1 Tax=Leeia speluncae TaxID=2884804 RepID=A0ABS8D9K5_9NEIS|nr:Arc family DNA-binding protein [Leeia speluncae]MCB6184293.1 Arc family DNA-binding protein [Leeia speluncae]